MKIYYSVVLWTYLIVSVSTSLCSGAEFLLQIVHGAIPKRYLKLDSSVPAAEIAVHILDYLYKKLNEICPVQGGEVVRCPGFVCI